LAPGGGVTLGCAAMLLEQILPNCALHSHRVAGDERGSLISLQSGFEIPFEFKRVYLVYGTRPGVERGFHAHKSLEQWVVCVSGSCVFTVDDGNDRREVLLDSPEKGLQIGSGIWREMRDFTPDAVLMVVASTHYELDDYIRSYDEFLSFVRSS
jgi:dTDP-4-dehydrorhamnose 3,5-epimerase-like enzyme